MNRKDILSQVQDDMKALYEEMVKKLIDRTDADSLANVAGKRLKAVQLDLADDMFTNERGRMLVLKSDEAKALTQSS